MWITGSINTSSGGPLLVTWPSPLFFNVPCYFLLCPFSSHLPCNRSLYDSHWSMSFDVIYSSIPSDISKDVDYIYQLSGPCDRVPGTDKLKICSWFQRVLCVVTLPHALGQNIRTAGACQGKDHSTHDSQGTEWKGRDTSYILLNHVPHEPFHPTRPPPKT